MVEGKMGHQRCLICSIYGGDKQLLLYRKGILIIRLLQESKDFQRETTNSLCLFL